MNPFSKRIHQIKYPDLDLVKGTRNPFLDVKSVSGFTERNTPKDLKGDQFLCMCKAEEDGLLTISIGIDLGKSAGYNNNNNDDHDDDDLEVGHPQSGSLST